jgi:hypothetical protein
VKEISLAERQFLRGPRLRLVVVERFDYLWEMRSATAKNKSGVGQGGARG